MQDVFDAQVCEKEIARSLVLEGEKCNAKLEINVLSFSCIVRDQASHFLRSSYIRKLRSNTSIRNRNRILYLSLVAAKDRISAPK